MADDPIFPGRPMSDEARYLLRATTILHNMALENASPWRRFFSRWYIADEPLRKDAARLLHEMGTDISTPVGARCLEVWERVYEGKAND